MATCGQKLRDCAGMPKLVAGDMIMDAKWYENTRKLHKLPSDYGMKYEDVKFQALDGCQLSAWYIPSKDPSLKKLAIVGHQSWSEANRSGCLDHTKHGMMAVEGIDYVKLHKEWDLLSSLFYFCLSSLRLAGNLKFNLCRAVQALGRRYSTMRATMFWHMIFATMVNLSTSCLPVGVRLNFRMPQGSWTL